MTEKTLVIVEVSGGCVVDVYAPNAEYIIVDWDNIDAGSPLPTRDDARGASDHASLDDAVFRAIFGREG